MRQRGWLGDEREIEFKQVCLRAITFSVSFGTEGKEPEKVVQ